MTFIVFEIGCCNKISTFNHCIAGQMKFLSLMFFICFSILVWKPLCLSQIKHNYFRYRLFPFSLCIQKGLVL